MSTLDVKLNHAGMAKLLKSPEIVGALREMGKALAAIADRAADAEGGHVVADPELGPHRARVAVITATAEAMRAEATRRSFTFALGKLRAR